MSAKKVVSRTLAIALGIICVILIAGAAGIAAYYTMAINDKNTTISNLQSQKSQIETWLEANETEYQDYASSHNHSNADYDAYVASHQHTNSEYDSLQSAYNDYVSTHQHTNTEYNLLQSIANLGEQQNILNQYTVNQGSSTHTLVTSFQASFAGYLDISMTSTTTNAYIIVEYWYQGRLFSVQKTMGTAGETFICLLPSSVAIYVGNSNFNNGATHTITATYHY